MTLREIRQLPTLLPAADYAGANGVHQSCFRATHALAKVIELLRSGAPSEVILEIAQDLEEADDQTKAEMPTATARTLDQCCNQPDGTFAEYVKGKDASERVEEDLRKAMIRHHKAAMEARERLGGHGEERRNELGQQAKELIKEGKRSSKCPKRVLEG